MNPTHDYIVNRYFKDKATNYSTKLYNELKNRYNIEVMFEGRCPSEKEFKTNSYIPGEVRYKNGKWIVKIFNVADVHIDRVISHELLHVLLRYRHKLPFVKQEEIARKQAIVVTEMDHKMINAELDNVYGKRKDINKDPETIEVLKIIGAYLDEIDGNIKRGKYIEIFEKCVKALNEKMPELIL